MQICMCDSTVNKSRLLSASRISYIAWELYRVFFKKQRNLKNLTVHLLWWLTAVDALAETCSENRNKFHSDLHLRNKLLFYYKYCLSKEILSYKGSICRTQGNFSCFCQHSNEITAWGPASKVWDFMPGCKNLDPLTDSQYDVWVKRWR